MCLFNIVSEMAMRKVLEGCERGYVIGGRKISNLRYADDIILVARSAQELQLLVNRLEVAGQEYNMLINKSKTVVMATNGEILNVIVDEKPLIQVQSYQYLGANIAQDSSCETN